MSNISLKIQKKDLWLLSTIMMLLVGTTFIIAYSQPIPDPGHGGDNVSIYINGVSKNLQQAIDDGDFSSCPITGGTYSGAITKGHKGEEIIVNIGGNIKSFQESINDDSLTSAVAGTSPSNFGNVLHGNTGDETWINISGQEKTLQQAINNEDFGACLPCAGPPVYTDGYSLNYLARNSGSWITLISNSNVISTSAPPTYSTTQGNWLPSNTYTSALKLNVAGTHQVSNKHPTAAFDVRYRVWGNTRVRVRTRTWAETVCISDGGLRIKLDRTDTFQRQDANTILINGNPRTIAPGNSYNVQVVTWNPANHGMGNSSLGITNDACSDYFDIQQYVIEVDEQCDSSRIQINGYIEPA